MSTKETMIKKRFNGDEEAYKAWMRSLGSIGGKKSRNPPNHPTQFNNNRELASRAGKIGRPNKNLKNLNRKRSIKL